MTRASEHPASQHSSPHPASPRVAGAGDHGRERPATTDSPAAQLPRWSGDLGALRMPEPRPPVRTDGLWRHTCFEAFIGHAGVRRILGIQLFAVGRLGGLSLQRLPRRHGSRSRARHADLLLRPAGRRAGARRAPGPRTGWRVRDGDRAASRRDGRHRRPRAACCHTGRSNIPRRNPISTMPTASWSTSTEVARVIQFGIDRLLGDIKLLRELEGRRVALLAHPASMTAEFEHSLDALRAVRGLDITAAFGPQHGLRGDKQDNMIESPDFRDPVHGIPVFSLYGEVRRPTEEMLDHFDVLLVDLQDVGCRIYTFITTLLYVLEAAAQHGKTVWVLDRPNPAGRPDRRPEAARRLGEFRGRGPDAHAPRTHAGRARHLVREPLPSRGGLPRDPDARLEARIEAPGFGWPVGERNWVNPSPNAANLSMARAYAGTVMLEGTTLSEGRGTTRPLELLGAPGLDPRSLLTAMNRIMPAWLRGCRLRPCWFEPTFQKHAGKLCSGFQIHVEDGAYEHGEFRRGGWSPARSSASAGCAANIRCGAISLTSTNARGSPSISSMAASCCASGWTIRRRRRPISTSWRRATRRHGPSSAPTSCSIAEKSGEAGAGTRPGPAGWPALSLPRSICSSSTRAPWSAAAGRSCAPRPRAPA